MFTYFLDCAGYQGLKKFYNFISATCAHVVEKKDIGIGNLMALFSELLTTIIILITRPFTLFKLVCLFCMKTAFVFVHTWIELGRATVSFYLNLVWGMISWTIAILSLPLRMLTALQRERQVSL